jgi:hypothetical protein
MFAYVFALVKISGRNDIGVNSFFGHQSTKSGNSVCYNSHEKNLLFLK